ncbi:hypothetical protein ACIF8T_01405 [Streptomyces sp. NPDC085946]|uniref:hypothetical protein n=1 Tax=Streptomyces sp. NPDC085946 TaxID=3365744 RepID=UPI0037D5C660
MYAVKVVLLPSPDPAVPDGPDPPAGMPGDRWLGEIADRTRTDPQPGIAHVSMARWGSRLVSMTFVEAATLDEALIRARTGWARWLSLPGLLSGWVLGDCAPDRYLSSGRQETPPARVWHDDAMST